MLQGAPAFPGEADELEQLQTIWTVRESAPFIQMVKEKESDALMWPCRSWACPLRTAGLESASCPTINQVSFTISVSVSKCFSSFYKTNQSVSFILSLSEYFRFYYGHVFSLYTLFHFDFFLLCLFVSFHHFTISNRQLKKYCGPALSCVSCTKWLKGSQQRQSGEKASKITLLSFNDTSASACRHTPAENEVSMPPSCLLLEVDLNSKPSLHKPPHEYSSCSMLTNRESNQLPHQLIVYSLFNICTC